MIFEKSPASGRGTSNVSAKALYVVRNAAAVKEMIAERTIHVLSPA